MGKVEIELKQLTDNLQNEYKNWNNLKERGGSDPLHSDGTNLYLVRNHIGYFRRKIKELCENSNLPLPDIYRKPVPPEMPMDYMVNADEIRKQAKASLEIYKANEYFQKLAEMKGGITGNKELTAHCILGYMVGLEQAIKADDLVTMRRHRRPERYLDSPRAFLEGLQPEDLKEQEQVAMF